MIERKIAQWPEILDRNKYQEEKWLIPSLIPVKGRIIVYGHGGVGKTQIVYDLIASLSTGTPFLGVHKVNSKYKTLIVAGEGDHDINRNRLRVASRSHGVREVSQIAGFEDVMQLVGGSYLLDNVEDCALFNNLVGRATPALVAIDPLDSFFLGDDNSAKETRPVRRSLDALIDEYSCSVLIIHHASSDEGVKGMRKPRGTTAWYGWADTIIRVSLNKDLGGVEISVEKQRNNQSHFSFTVLPIREERNSLLYYQLLEGPTFANAGCEKTKEQPEKKETPEEFAELVKEELEGESKGEDKKERPEVKLSPEVEAELIAHLLKHEENEERELEQTRNAKPWPLWKKDWALTRAIFAHMQGRVFTTRLDLLSILNCGEKRLMKIVKSLYDETHLFSPSKDLAKQLQKLQRGRRGRQADYLLTSGVPIDLPFFHDQLPHQAYGGDDDPATPQLHAALVELQKARVKDRSDESQEN